MTQVKFCEIQQVAKQCLFRIASNEAVMVED